MSYYSTGCADCGANNFVTHYADGDVVCTSCGLVAESHIIMDDAFYNPSFLETHGFPADHDDHHSIGTKQVSKHDTPNNQETDNKLRSACLALNVADAVARDARSIFADIRKKQIFRGQPLNAAVACSIYISFSMSSVGRVRRDAKEIYEPLGIDGPCFFKTLKQIYQMNPEWNAKMHTTKEDDSVMRQIQQVEDITDDKYLQVQKEVAILGEMRKKKHLMMGSPPMIVNAILIYVVATAKLGIHINKTKYVGLGWVSRATLDKYSKVLIELLKKNVL